MYRYTIYWLLLASLLAVSMFGCDGGRGGALDNTPPTVVSTYPANGDEDVAVNTTITATFSEAMKPETLTAETFTLRNGVTSVAGAVTCTGALATFTPASPLATDTLFTATITTGVHDLVCNTMVADYVWTFRTAAVPLVQYVLTTSAVNGTVTRSPNLALYDSGTVVTPTAVPAAGYHFTGWSGDLLGTTNPDPVTMTRDKTITANFELNLPSTFSLTTVAVHGTVGRSLDRATYDDGTILTLTAAPAPGYHFTGWAGDLIGAVNPSPITMDADKVVTANFAINTYTLTTIAVNGTVAKLPSQATYNHGTVVTLTAAPALGYHFTNWSGDLTGLVNPGQVTMTGNKTVTANFEANPPSTFTLTATGVHGTVTKSPNLATYTDGTIVTLTAAPATGYHFTGWSGDLGGALNPAPITMNADKVVTANFAINTYTLTTTAVNGTVTKLPNTATHNYGTVVTVTAIPAIGYHFTGWSGDLSGITNPATVTMNANKAVTANFVANPPSTFTLTTIAVNGTVTKSPNLATYNAGALVTLTAAPATGYHFTGWSGSVTGTTNPATVTMNANKTVTAAFAINTYTLTVIAVNGSVTKLPNQTTYDYGTSAVLTAVPATGYRFIGWTGALTGTTNPAQVTMTSNKTVTANFAINTYTLTVTAAHGTVTKLPNQTTYAHGTNVTLSAVAATGYHFTGWSGDLTSSVSPATITMNANKAVTADFALNPVNTYTLTVIGAGGTVTKLPDQPTYNSGALVTLTAVPQTGFHFTGWSGALTGLTNPAQITMTSNKTVTANFAINTYTLTITALHGTVTKAPNQLTYDYGDLVQLTAEAALGYHFTGWSGGLTGTLNPTMITMNANKAVTANFAINTYTLTTTAVNGTVTKTPNQLNYNHGALVQLAAAAAPGYHFTGWSGDLTGTISPATITMTANKNVTAEFVRDHLGPAPVDLRSAGDFTAIAGATITNTGPTIVNGNIALSPGNAITGFPPGVVNGVLHVADPIAAQAKLDLTTAYNDAAGRTLNFVTVADGELGGKTFEPGLYRSGISSFAITSSALTLDALGDPTAVWIFQMPSSTLTVGNGQQVILAGGAQPGNIFWQVGTSATIGTTAIVQGNILADQAITLETGATLNGRALTRIAALTLDSNAVTVPAP